MAQGGPQLDYHVLKDLKQRFPEIPENVVSQCLLQNNNNVDLCFHLLAQESNRYLYEEYHSPEEAHLSRNHMLHISLGYPDGTAGNAGARQLVHSSSDGHIEPQRGAFHEPQSAPAAVAPSQGYNPFFMGDQGRSSSAATPPPTIQGVSPTYTPVPARYMTPITVTLSQNIPSVPQALQIQHGGYSNSGSTLYIRPSPSQSPQPWASPGPAVYQPSPYTTPTYQSPYSSPQHQVQQPPHVFLPISPPSLPNIPYQHSQSIPYRPYMTSKASMKNPIEMALDGRPRSNSPVHTSPATLYMATSPSPSSPSRAISMTGPPAPSFHPAVYLHQGPARPRPSSSPQPASAAYIKIKVSPGQAQRATGSPPVETESLLNIVDQGEKHGAPPPILPISALPGNVASQVSHMPRRSSSGSDDYAYTQALLLHQRARMERLMKGLQVEQQKLEHLKSEVNDMEYDALQRRFRRVNSTSLIPRPEEMTRIRTQNRQLQIDIDCTLKETDLLQTCYRGKFDPKAMNFYDNIQPGPVVPPKPGKKDVRKVISPAEAQRDEDFEGAQWNCDSCTFLNHPALNRCEQCEMPRYT
ncbi:TGF-beta-activated kinase 1 and MAP3K7-binding protein 3 [Brachyhypopomus gauderio]|uniref:TGF-beta-activated kinase 1 and MAP3K7-binding protein 3 n=1 Tax=Brachyhypopomus gauderio TaxID=698409 RepID=UPI00404324ED